MKRLLLAALAVGCVVVAAKMVAQPRAAVPDKSPSAAHASSAVEVPAPSEKAVRYYRSGVVLWACWNAVALLVPFAFAFSGAGAKLRAALTRLVGDRWFPLVTAYGIAWTVIVAMLELPLAYYSDFVREHAFGLSNQTLGKWCADWSKGLAVSCVIAALLTWLPYLLLKRSPRRWWLYTGLAAFPLTALMLVVTPVWIDPLFNDFGPMKDKALESRILALADRAGIEGSRVYEVAKSVDTSTVNAYVTGFGGTKRIVLWDTIIAKLPQDELLFVMGHEMGHYVLGHVAQAVVLVPLGITFGLFVINLVALRLVARFGARLGFTELSDIGSMPLLIFLFVAGSILASPVPLAWSRHLEHEADRFGLELTRNNEAAARAFIALQQENLSVPRPAPILVFLRSSHPPLGERIDFSNSYRPWETGGELRYGELVRGKETGDRR